MKTKMITTHNLSRFLALFGLIFLAALTACSREDEVVGGETAVSPPTTSPTSKPAETAVPVPTATPENIEETPTTEPTAEPTPLPEPDAVNFSLTQAESSLPDDLYQQISYFGMIDFFFEGLLCDEMVYEEIEIDSQHDLGAYAALSGSTESDPTLYDSIEVRTCDWQDGDEISIKLTLPSGETISQTHIYGQADSFSPRPERINQLAAAEYPFDYGALGVYFVPGFDSELGAYRFEIEGNGRSFSHTITVTPPNQPRVFDDGSDEAPAWLLSQFAPGEQVRLVAYGSRDCDRDAMYEVDINYVSLCLIGWQRYTVPENGRLNIQAEPASTFVYYAIVGEQSGTFALNTLVNAEVVQSNAHVRADWIPWLYESNTRTTALHRLSPSTLVRITGQHESYRLVQLSDGTEGWVASVAVEVGETAVSPPTSYIYLTNGTDLPEWVYLPTAPYFYMGSSSYDTEFTEEAEQPTHDVSLSPFWIQRTEVSNAAYAECVAAGSCTAPSSIASNTQLDYFTNTEFANYPVIFVTQPQAQTYCEWIGGRLPTEAEWEFAARYPKNSYYTWGNLANAAADNPDLANFGKLVGDTTPVYNYISGATESGLFNMHGNVWEWTADWFDPAYYQNSPSENPTGPESGNEKVARGGSWSTSLEYISLTNRFNRDPNQGYDNVGFRCVSTTNINGS
ncbi:MAG: hypothetical protein DWQ04_34715 [Chloroflexi bacterium]|nr:MAG: hypothetical protein DWQ04_34715 [Chloroflexota bacterium]